MQVTLLIIFFLVNMYHIQRHFSKGSAKNASCGVASCELRVTNRQNKDISNPSQGKIIS